MNVIANIREARMARKVSQATLAEAIGMSTEGYNRFEKRGGNKVTIEQLTKIANALKMSLLELLDFNLEVELKRKDTGEVSDDSLAKYNRIIDHTNLCFELFDKWLRKNKKVSFSYVGHFSDDKDKQDEIQAIIEALNEPELRMIFFALVGLPIPPMVSREDEIVGRLTPYSADENLLLRNYMKVRYNL